MSKIPVLSKNKDKQIYDKRKCSNMELDGEKMILMAEIELLKKEKAAALEKLDAAESVIDQLQTQMKAMHESQNEQLCKIKTLNGKFNKAEKVFKEKIESIKNDSKKNIKEIEKVAYDKVEQAKIYTVAKIAKFTEQKDAEVQEWKAKYDELNEIYIADYLSVNKVYPVLTDAEVKQLISALYNVRVYMNRSQVNKINFWLNGNRETVQFEFASGCAMSTWFSLSKTDGITLFKNVQIRDRALESEPSTE